MRKNPHGFPESTPSSKQIHSPRVRDAGQPIKLRYHDRAGGLLACLTNPKSLCPPKTAQSKKEGSKALQVIGWFSIGMAVAALSIFLGAELRSRSKFKKRTPYDFYANAGEQQASEFGVGI